MITYIGGCFVTHSLVAVSLKDLVFNLLNLELSLNWDNAHWWVAPWMGNGPLWTMTFIWWFYPLIALYRKYGNKGYILETFWLLSVVGDVTYKIYPTVFSMILFYSFMLAVGSYCCQCYVEGRFDAKRIGKAVAYTVALLLVHSLLYYDEIPVFSHHHHPNMEMRHLVDLVGILVGAFVLKKWTRLRHFLSKVLRVFGYAAPFSFALYLIHYRVGLDLLKGGISLWAMLLLLMGIAWLMECVIQKQIIKLFR